MKKYKSRKCTDGCFATLPAPKLRQTTITCDYCGNGYDISTFELMTVVASGGAIASGRGAVAVGAGGVIIGGNVAGSIINGNVVASNGFIGAKCRHTRKVETVYTYDQKAPVGTRCLECGEMI